MKRLLNEFRKFAMRGNVFDLAVGVVIGTAFTSIVNSIVGDLIMPLISLISGNMEFSNLFVALDGGQYASLADITADVPVLRYGSFLQAVVNFLIVSFSLFLIIRGLNKLQAAFKKKEAAEAPPPAPPSRKCPYCLSDIADEATRCPHCTSLLEAPIER
jgi:large conductance mechanosensitive channel